MPSFNTHIIDGNNSSLPIQNHYDHGDRGTIITQRSSRPLTFALSRRLEISMIFRQQSFHFLLDGKITPCCTQGILKAVSNSNEHGKGAVAAIGQRGSSSCMQNARRFLPLRRFEVEYLVTRQNLGTRTK